MRIRLAKNLTTDIFRLFVMEVEKIEVHIFYDHCTIIDQSRVTRPTFLEFSSAIENLAVVRQF